MSEQIIPKPCKTKAMDMYLQKNMDTLFKRSAKNHYLFNTLRRLTLLKKCVKCPNLVALTLFKRSASFQLDDQGLIQEFSDLFNTPGRLTLFKR